MNSYEKDVLTSDYNNHLERIACIVDEFFQRTVQDRLKMQYAVEYWSIANKSDAPAHQKRCPFYFPHWISLVVVLLFMSIFPK